MYDDMADRMPDADDRTCPDACPDCDNPCLYAAPERHMCVELHQWGVVR